jgi:hypothetical protein
MLALRAVILSCAACVCLLGGTQGVHAQASPPIAAGGSALSEADMQARRTTMARALFEEGLHFVDAGQWADAQDRFARVLEIRYSAVAAYNLGLAQARLGHGVIASATLRKLLADSTLEPKVRDPASALLAEVEARFAWLTIRVLGPCTDCKVYVDREEWPRAVWGVSVPCDAGTHALELRYRGTVLAKDTILTTASVRSEAALAARSGQLWAIRVADAKARRDALSAGATAPSRANAAEGSLFERPLFWIAMGVLVAGGVTAAVIAAH